MLVSLVLPSPQLFPGPLKEEGVGGGWRPPWRPERNTGGGWPSWGPRVTAALSSQAAAGPRGAPGAPGLQCR